MKLLLAVGAAALLCGCAGKLQENAPEIQTKMDYTQQKLYGEYKLNEPVGIAFYIIQGDEELFLTTGMLKTVSADSHYRIASVTKNFYSAAIMLLAQENKLDLDAKLTDLMIGSDQPYVPDTPEFNIPYKEQISIRQLLNHTSGIGDIINQEIPADLDVPYAGCDYTDYMMEQTPDYQFTAANLMQVQNDSKLKYGEPGAGMFYSNMGYALVALIVERVSGMPHEEFIKQRFLTPNNLTATSIVTAGNEQELPLPALEGYRFNKKNKRFVPGTRRNASVFVGSGNMVSTPRDIAKWMKLLFSGNTAVHLASVQQMLPPPERDYGYGTVRFNRNLGYGHNGAFRGYFSYAYYNPATDTAWVLITNFYDNDNFGRQIELLTELQTDVMLLLNPED